MCGGTYSTTSHVTFMHETPVDSARWLKGDLSIITICRKFVAYGRLKSRKPNHVIYLETENLLGLEELKLCPPLNVVHSNSLALLMKFYQFQAKVGVWENVGKSKGQN